MDDKMIAEQIRAEVSLALDDVLEYLFSDGTLSNLVIFKGGTALAKVYGIDRFSKDIDLSYAGPGYGNIVGDIRAFIESAGLKILNVSANSVEFKVGSLRSNIDVSYLRDTINRNVKTTSVTSGRGGRYFVRAMDIDEILAEKIRAIAERREGKDLWDAYMILEKGVTCSKNQIGYKCDHSSPAFSFDNAEFIRIIGSWTEHRYLGQIRNYVEKDEIVPLGRIKRKLDGFISGVYG